jgi:hypothetical protein
MKLLEPPGIPPLSNKFFCVLVRLDNSLATLNLDFKRETISHFLHRSRRGNKIDFNAMMQVELAAGEVDWWKRTKYLFEPVPWLQERIQQEVELYQKINLVEQYRKLRQTLFGY